MKIFDVSSYGANCLSVVRVNKPKINSLNTNRTDTVAFKAVNKSMVIENLPIEKFKNIASEKIRCPNPRGSCRECTLSRVTARGVRFYRYRSFGQGVNGQRYDSR